MSALHIALYGKSGAGTTTVAENMSVALAESGRKVLQVGFDPGNGSTGALRGDRKVKSLLDAAREGGGVAFDEVVVKGYKGILCLETGLPELGAACTNWHSRSVMEYLKSRNFLDRHDPDLVFYDLSGEALCSGTAAALINCLADMVFIVTSADFRSLFAVNNFFRLLQSQSGRVARLGGIVANNNTSTFSETIIDDFAQKTETSVVVNIPRSLVVMQCSLYNRSVIEGAPRSGIASNFRRLAHQILVGVKSKPPKPFTQEELNRWARGWGDIILELESGVVDKGSGI